MFIQANKLSVAQERWIQIIRYVVDYKDLDLKIGDMNYTLGNMIAKMVSSHDFYKITKDAWDYGISKGYDLTKEINVCSAFYGSKHPTTLEHMVPCSKIRKEIIESNRTEEAIRDILCNSGYVTIMTMEENEKLNAKGLKSDMPTGWEYGDDPIKRYEDVGIGLPLREIKRKGRICR